jgi:hypothetical protein
MRPPGNGRHHPGPVVAGQQRAAHPDLAPLRVAAPPERVFERAVAVARGPGWEIVAAVPAEGRLEATDTTPWFGFKDDVVVRVMPSGAGGARADSDPRPEGERRRHQLGLEAVHVHEPVLERAAKVLLQLGEASDVAPGASRVGP